MRAVEGLAGAGTAAHVSLSALFCREREALKFREGRLRQQGLCPAYAQLFRSLLRLRGMECNAVSDYAEAFYCRKVIVG